jgi:prepilin-type N-terminal cleavage/methylation domain-containing protein
MNIPKKRSYPHQRNGLRLFGEGGRLVRLANSRTGPSLKWDGRPRSQSAFTLVEILVASSILAVMAIALYGGISFCFTNITLARQNLRATQIALEKMEIVRMYSWDQVNSSGFVPVDFTAPYFPTSGSDTNGGLTYYGTTVITNINLGTPYSADMRQVIVSLNWTNKNVKNSLEMSTYISQYGMQNYIY